jgi:hypothetical protein
MFFCNFSGVLFLLLVRNRDRPELRTVAMRMTRTLLLAALMLALSSAAWPQAQGGDVLWYGKAPPGWGGVVGSMKLLAPGVGWVERGGRFYWTTDNGANWKDITPPASSDLDEHISDFYFLDSQRGWALLSRFN